MSEEASVQQEREVIAPPAGHFKNLPVTHCSDASALVLGVLMVSVSCPGLRVIRCGVGVLLNLGPWGNSWIYVLNRLMA
jgi:hypothetical protein